MNPKKQKVVTHVDENTHRKLKSRAEKARRTIAAEAALILEQGVKTNAAK